MTTIKNKKIILTKGDTLDVTLEITLPDGSPYSVSAGDEIRFALKQGFSDKDVLIRKIIPHDTMRLRIESSETKQLKAGSQPYRYDIQITMEDGTVDTIIDRGELVVTEEVD